MPTRTSVRCDARQHDRLEWCPRCFWPTQWAPSPTDRPTAEAFQWPDIWREEPDPEPIKLGRNRRDGDGESGEGPPAADSGSGVIFWSLSRVVATVTVLITLASLTVIFAPTAAFGVASLAVLGLTALVVVHRAWRSEPG